MPLPAGTRLGPYEILSTAGAGGMGEVYKARDTRLGRDVAVKVLSAELAADAEFRERFEREAKTISALDHPNICTVYDVGHERRSDGSELRYLVMQFLDGETLDARLQKGALPIEQALKFGIEICAALDRAHRQGITHRDLKPGNVMLVRSAAVRPGLPGTAKAGLAQAKLLDFGLARTASPAGTTPAAATALAGTQSDSPLTSKGTVLGTFQYMSPEQIEGQEADARSDIFAFGCVLYEMLTGQRAFKGKSHASLLAAILKEPAPRVSAVQPLAPAGLDHIIVTCLAKDPDDRWQSSSDVARELTWILDTLSGSAPAAPQFSKGRRQRAFWPIVTVITAAAAAFAAWQLKPTAARSSGPIVRSVLSLAPGEEIRVNTVPAIAISTDGRHVAYRGGAPSKIYLRALNQSHSVAVPGTDGGSYPFFSPDGQSLAFFRNRAIWRVPLGGGAPKMVVEIEVGNLRGATWGDDDFIYYTPSYSAGIWRVQSTGGTPEQLTTPDFEKGEKTHRFPFVLPGSQALLFVVGTSRITSFDESRIEAFSLSTRQRHVVVEGGTFPQFVAPDAATGYLLYTREGKLIGLPVDPDALTAAGSPFTIADGMFRDSSSGMNNFGVSRDGLFVRVSGGVSNVEQTLLVVDKHGKAEPANAKPALFGLGSMSANGSSYVTYIAGATSQIALYDLTRGNSTRLTNEWDNENPVFSPDGSRIVFLSNRIGGLRNLYEMRADGSGEAVRILTSTDEQMPWAWTPDQHTVIFTSSTGENTDIWKVSLPDRKAQPLIATPDDEAVPALSPDGRWLAYQSDRSGRFEVYVQDLTGEGRRFPISDSGGTGPKWLSDRELIYRNGASVMSVGVTTAPQFRAAIPVQLFETPNILLDVIPSSQRLLMRTATPPALVNGLDIVVNWFEELRTKAGKQSPSLLWSWNSRRQFLKPVDDRHGRHPIRRAGDGREDHQKPLAIR